MTPTILTYIAAAMAHRRKLPDMDGESFLADMQMDGVERAEVALAIEERWHFEPSEAELESWQSVGDIVACVERRAA